MIMKTYAFVFKRTIRCGVTNSNTIFFLLNKMSFEHGPIIKMITRKIDSYSVFLFVFYKVKKELPCVRRWPIIKNFKILCVCLVVVYSFEFMTCNRRKEVKCNALNKIPFLKTTWCEMNLKLIKIFAL